MKVTEEQLKKPDYYHFDKNGKPIPDIYDEIEDLFGLSGRYIAVYFNLRKYQRRIGRKPGVPEADDQVKIDNSLDELQRLEPLVRTEVHEIMDLIDQRREKQ